MYSSEKNIHILIALLKAHNIKKIIASPGATNMSLVGSLQNDPWFEMYSSVDERSDAYMACGLAAESSEPVVLSCTGSTASRDYYPGLTEAYYRKLPILAVTSHHGPDRIGQLIPQNLDRRQIPHDIARLQVELPVVKDSRDEAFVVRETDRALLELKRSGGGPVHINVFTTYSTDFSVKELPSVRVIHRFFAWDKLPEMPKGRIFVLVGAHKRFSVSQIEAIERFCATRDAVVVCDHTSGYMGRYKVNPAIILQQRDISYPWTVSDLAIHIGEVSAAEYAWSYPTKNIWRVSEDGEIRDTCGKLTNLFEMSEEFFFSYYSDDSVAEKHEQYDLYQNAFKEIYAMIPNLPFSNIWNVSQLSKRLPTGSLLHISASNTRRCWNMFALPEGVESVSNVGCCGIDGCTSTMIGSSLNNPNRICYLVTGDLAFFYDLNSIGNRHVGNNIRILLVNNGIGAEFKLSVHRIYQFGEDANKYMAAGGHFGNKSPDLVKHYAQDLGFKYLSAKNKEDSLKAVEEFTQPEIGEQPMLFEVFTKHEDESDALQLMTHIIVDSKHKMVNAIKSVVGEKGLDIAKSLINSVKK